MSQLFETQHLTKRFTDDGNPETVLLDVNIQVQPGEFLCLMGPSGCGKSTLLRLMAGLDQPTSGYVLNRPQRIGFVFQAFGLMPWLTVEQNIAYGLELRGVYRPEIRKTVAGLVENLGLNGLELAHPKELSGGQRQRVGIARALAINPDVLMLDEAFSALDSTTAEELRADLLRIWHERKMTVVMVTHLPEEAAQLADRIIVFSAKPGRVEREMENKLPRPRQLRSPEFFALVDHLERLIRRGSAG